MHSHPQTGAATSGDTTPDEVDRTYRKVFFRLIPLLFLCYVISYIDRVNISFAKLQFMHDLGFSESTYGLGAGLFFIGRQQGGRGHQRRKGEGKQTTTNHLGILRPGGLSSPRSPSVGEE